MFNMMVGEAADTGDVAKGETKALELPTLVVFKIKSFKQEVLVTVEMLTLRRVADLTLICCWGSSFIDCIKG